MAFMLFFQSETYSSAVPSLVQPFRLQTKAGLFSENTLRTWKSCQEIVLLCSSGVGQGSFGLGGEYVRGHVYIMWEFSSSLLAVGTFRISEEEGGSGQAVEENPAQV